jgi:hypothetical protein
LPYQLTEHVGKASKELCSTSSPGMAHLYLHGIVNFVLRQASLTLFHHKPTTIYIRIQLNASIVLTYSHLYNDPSITLQLVL